MFEKISQKQFIILLKAILFSFLDRGDSGSNGRFSFKFNWTGSFFEMDICQKCNKPTNSKKILFLSSESAEQQKTVLWYFITFYFNEVTEQSDRLNASLQLFSRKRRLKGLKRLQTKEGGSDGSLDWGCLKFHWKRCNVTVTGPHLRLACPYQQVLAKDVRS